MIKKIIAIKNVGRFKNSAAPGTPQLREFTFVFGANGLGKTTFGAILRSLQSGDADIIRGRRRLSSIDAPRVELLLESGPVQFNGERWSEEMPSISIFDGDFVADNVHSGEVVGVSHKRNLYRVIIGAEGISLAVQDAELAAASRQKTGEISATKKAIESHVPAGMTASAFIALPLQPDLETLIEQQERKAQAVQRAQAISDRQPLSAIDVPRLPAGFETLLSRNVDDVAEDAETLLAAHLEAHSLQGDAREWIRLGLAATEGETCPFCGQSIQGLPLVNAFKAYFSEAYQQLAAELHSIRDALAEGLGTAAETRWQVGQERHSSAVGFWAELCDLDVPSLEYPTGAIPAMRELVRAAGQLLDQKAASPLDAVAVDADCLEAMALHAEVVAAIAQFNDAVTAANLLIEDKKASVKADGIEQVAAELKSLRAAHIRHSDAVSGLCAELSRLDAEKKVLEQSKELAREALNAHTVSVVKPYEDRINELLDAFNAGFSITETGHTYPSGMAASTYQLVVDGQTIQLGDGDTPRDEPSFKNTLSSGDRTTLALAFFLAHLERDPQLESRVVVFDDPFNSQDAFRRRQTVLEIMKIGRKCRQVIVLSHDQGFLKLLWEKAANGQRVALSVVDHRLEGSKLLEMDLDEACRGRTVVDVDDLQSFLTTGAGNVQDVVRKLRVVLETHCRTVYPSCFLAADWLGDIVRKTREGGEEHPAWPLFEELDEINDYSKEYHHGEDLGDASGVAIDPSELSGFVRRTLRIVNASMA